MADAEPEDHEQFVLRLLRAQSLTELQRSGLLAESSDAEEIARALEPLWRSARLQVNDVRVNGTRSDVRVQSDDGRAWLAVLHVDRSRSPALIAVTVYERPDVFRSDGSGRVVVLNGPSSVGKSALMAAFVDAASTPWLCLDEPMFGRLATKYLAWPAAAGPSADGFLAALAASARVGNQVIVSSGGLSQDRFREALIGVETFYVGLDAPLAVLLERQLRQEDKFGGLAEESVGIHAGWVYDLRIDTASCEPPDAARLLLDFLAR